MKRTYEEIKNRKNIIVWGNGRLLQRYKRQLDPGLDITGVCDSDQRKWGSMPMEGILCGSQNDLTAENVVIIAIQSEKDVKLVENELQKKNIDYCYICEAVKGYRDTREKIAINESRSKFKNVRVDYEHIKHYISIHVPYKSCNLQCTYCYVRQVRDFYEEQADLPSPEFIRAAFSPQRWGGISFINFCAEGETLLMGELLPIIKGLIEDGHYIHIVTNGTITKAFEEFINQKIDLTHVLFKFSYHYLELKRKNLLNIFANNVRKMKDHGASISLELVASDELVPYIDEVKEETLRLFGALPQLTVPRNETDREWNILTKYSEEQYRNIWASFQSEMFTIKMDHMHVYRTENCMAGVYSVWLDLEKGDVYKCCKFGKLCNVYENISDEILFEAVGHNCELPFCYNEHIYFPLGIVEGINTVSYYQIRDRECLDGSHWITEKMKKILIQNLHDNNTARM